MRGRGQDRGIRYSGTGGGYGSGKDVVTGNEGGWTHDTPMECSHLLRVRHYSITDHCRWWNPARSEWTHQWNGGRDKQVCDERARFSMMLPPHLFMHRAEATVWCFVKPSALLITRIPWINKPLTDWCLRRMVRFLPMRMQHCPLHQLHCTADCTPSDGSWSHTICKIIDSVFTTIKI